MGEIQWVSRDSKSCTSPVSGQPRHQQQGWKTRTLHESRLASDWAIWQLPWTWFLRHWPDPDRTHWVGLSLGQRFDLSSLMMGIRESQPGVLLHHAARWSITAAFPGSISVSMPNVYSHSVMRQASWAKTVRLARFAPGSSQWWA
jgi:hypothetical protein